MLTYKQPLPHLFVTRAELQRDALMFTLNTDDFCIWQVKTSHLMCNQSLEMEYFSAVKYDGS